MSKLTVLSAFTGTHADAARQAAGFAGTAAFISDQETAPGRNLYPEMAFTDPTGEYHEQGSGFPAFRYNAQRPDLRLTADVLCIKAESYGPEWGDVSPAMRAMGLDRYNGNALAAKEALIGKLKSFTSAGTKCAPACGLYGFAPLEGTSDDRLRVLLTCTAYMPSFYYARPLEPGEVLGTVLDLRPPLLHMPKREWIPIVCGTYVYADGFLTADEWSKVIRRCLSVGAKRVILWADSGGLGAVDAATMTADRMRKGASYCGVELV